MKTALNALAFLVIITGVLWAPVPVMAADVASVVATCPVCGGFLQPPCPLCYSQNCVGQCIKPGGPAACKALKCIQGDGSTDAASSAGSQMMQQLAQQLLQQLMSGGGGGGEFTDPNTYAPSTTNSVLTGIVDVVPTDTYQAVDDQLQNLLGATGGEESAESSVFGALQTQGSVAANNTAPQSSRVVSTAVQTVQNAYNRLTGNVNTKKTTDAGGSTVAAEGQSGETGIGAFFGGIFGGSSGANSSLLAKLCTSRPWASGIISSVFSSTLFDSLCEKNGLTVGRPATLNTVGSQTQSAKALLTCPARIAPNSQATIHWKCVTGGKSSGVGFDTSGLGEGSMQLTLLGDTILGLKCADGSAATCAIQIGKPSAEIQASPMVVNLGGRTKLFWTSENVESCVVEGIGMQEKSTHGASMTPAIYDTTTFSITCEVGDGSTITKSVKVGI